MLWDILFVSFFFTGARFAFKLGTFPSGGARNAFTRAYWSPPLVSSKNDVFLTARLSPSDMHSSAYFCENGHFFILGFAKRKKKWENKCQNKGQLANHDGKAEGASWLSSATVANGIRNGVTLIGSDTFICCIRSKRTCQVAFCSLGWGYHKENNVQQRVTGLH